MRMIMRSLLLTVLCVMFFASNTVSLSEHDQWQEKAAHNPAPTAAALQTSTDAWKESAPPSRQGVLQQLDSVRGFDWGKGKQFRYAVSPTSQLVAAKDTTQAGWGSRRRRTEWGEAKEKYDTAKGCVDAFDECKSISSSCAEAVAQGVADPASDAYCGFEAAADGFKCGKSVYECVSGVWKYVGSAVKQYVHHVKVEWEILLGSCSPNLEKYCPAESGCGPASLSSGCCFGYWCNHGQNFRYAIGACAELEKFQSQEASLKSACQRR